VTAYVSSGAWTALVLAVVVAVFVVVAPLVARHHDRKTTRR